MRVRTGRHGRRRGPGLAAIAVVASVVVGVMVVPGSRADAASGPGPGPAMAAATAFESVRDDPVLLRSFLRAMPKGADLHNHLFGSVYAEDYISWAAADGLCFDDATLTIVAPPCHDPDRRPIRAALGDTAFQDRIIDAISMRHFTPEPSPGISSGYGQFFATFGRVDLAEKGHRGDALAAATEQAAADHARYVEYLTTPGERPTAALAAAMDFDARDLAGTIASVPAATLRAAAAATSAELDQAERRFAAREHCSQPARARPACDVEIRFQYQVIRALPPRWVMAQFMLGFALARTDPDVVAVNLVSAENGPVALRDYALQLRMIQALQRTGPRVHVALHAGELALGLVPPRVLGTHVRQAVDAGAERIGHGADIAYDVDPQGLMRRMAAQHVAVEIQLTSNAVVLALAGTRHPFLTYLAAGVPVTLNTDDEGVLRTDLTHEYQLAVQDYGLAYDDLLALSRQGLESAFLPGSSLWQDGVRSAPVPACADSVGQATPSAGCQAFLQRSQKATMQFDLEARLAAFTGA